MLYVILRHDMIDNIVYFFRSLIAKHGRNHGGWTGPANAAPTETKIESVWRKVTNISISNRWNGLVNDLLNQTLWRSHRDDQGPQTTWWHTSSRSNADGSGTSVHQCWACPLPLEFTWVEWTLQVCNHGGWTTHSKAVPTSTTLWRPHRHGSGPNTANLVASVLVPHSEVTSVGITWNKQLPTTRKPQKSWGKIVWRDMQIFSPKKLCGEHIVDKSQLGGTDSHLPALEPSLQMHINSGRFPSTRIYEGRENSSQSWRLNKITDVGEHSVARINFFGVDVALRAVTSEGARHGVIHVRMSQQE